MTAAWLKTLDEIEGGALPLVGGKAYNLATLRRHGLPVLPGLVVTTAFFEAHLRYHRFTPLWAGSPNVAVTEDALCWLADTLKIKPLAHELTAALLARLAETFPDIESFAVRSSAVDEDARQYAFSGVHLTELGVPREMVPVSLSRCWASALSKPALEYRRQHGIPIQSIRLAVLIQPFIQPSVAGVAFTVNPISGARDELVVEATSGLGSEMVSGRVTPTRYRLAKRPPDYPRLDWTPGDTPPSMSPSQLLHDVSSGGDERGPLSISQLRTLAHHLEQVEALMSAPQDVEWAIAREGPGRAGKFIFFQTRPITVLPGTASFLDVEWSRANHREFLPDLPSPLCASLLERTQDRALSFFKTVGFDVQNAGPYLKLIYGRPYLNLTLARRLLAQSGLNPAGVLWMLGHAELSGERIAVEGVDWWQAWKARRAVVRLLLRGLRAKPWLERFKQLAAEIRGALAATDWEETSPANLLTRFRLRTQLTGQMAETDFTLSAAAIATFSVVAQGSGSMAGDVRRFVKEAIGPDVQTADAWQGHRLLELARIARTDEQARRYLSHPQDSFDGYRQALAGTSFLSAFDQFMSKSGHHAIFESDPGWPRYGENPSLLLATMAQMTEAPTLPDQHENELAESQAGLQSGNGDKRGVQQRANSPSSAMKRLRPWHSWLLHPVIKRLRHLAQMRGQLRALYGQSMTDCRLWDLKLAERWVARNWLAEPGDYFWLTMEEIERALMAEAEMGPTLPALVNARRETYQMYARTEMPYTLRESDVARLVPGQGLAGTALASVLSGLPISPGQVQGRVVVLHRPEDAAHMQKGAILVAPSTDPAWFLIIPQARGLIVEKGGLLSHGSIIAREFGLPAVADIPDATQRFHNGDLVLLDGSTGLVQILEPAAVEIS